MRKNANSKLAALPQAMKKVAEIVIFTNSSTIVIPFLLVRLSKNFLVRGGWAQYCTASNSMVMIAGAVTASAAWPPMTAIAFTLRAVLVVPTREQLGAYGATLDAKLAAGKGLRAALEIS